MRESCDRMSVTTYSSLERRGPADVAEARPGRLTVVGWFEGLNPRQIESVATECLRRSHAFVLQWWGLTEILPGEHSIASLLELGDRVARDLSGENGRGHGKREDQIVTRAVNARPLSFVDLLGMGEAEAGHTLGHSRDRRLRFGPAHRRSLPGPDPR